MKIKDGFVIREIAGECVVIALGEASKSFNGMIKLNESARILWECLAKGCEKEDMIEAVLATYDVDRDTVENDVDRLLYKLNEANILA
jgi:hypothetical protein